MILLLTEQGAKVNIDGGKIVVKTDNLKRTLPKELIESVSVFGNIQMTTQFIKFCMIKNIPITLFSLRGEYFGRCSSTCNQNVLRIKKQMEVMVDETFRLEFAKRIIEAKANNQNTILRRYRKYNEDIDNEIEQISILSKKILKTQTVEELLGYEGIISRYYYKAFGKLMPEEFKFNKRTRRPPKDPVNSMLSLGYTILLHEIIGQIEAVSLSAYGGVIHGHRRNHPSLASDLIEEYRQIIVDSLVLSMIMNDKVDLTDFQIVEQGVFLEKKFLKKYLAELQNKMKTRQNYLNYLENPVCYRKAIYHQCSRFSKSIENSDPKIYEPLRIR